VYLNIYYLSCIQPHETQEHIPKNQDEFLQYIFAIHITITTRILYHNVYIL